MCHTRRGVSVQIKRSLSAPLSSFDVSFDLDLPVECDDEFWESEDPDQAFKQPAGKPSTAAFYISYIKLTQVLAFALRTIVRRLFLNLSRVG